MTNRRYIPPDLRPWTDPDPEPVDWQELLKDVVRPGASVLVFCLTTAGICDKIKTVEYKPGGRHPTNEG